MTSCRDEALSLERAETFVARAAATGADPAVPPEPSQASREPYRWPQVV
jgi:hypothetical protein